MANGYYTPTDIVTQTKARSSLENSDRASVEVGFDRLPTKASMDAGSVWFVADTGAADVYVVAMQKTATSYTDGMSFTMKVSATNTGACTVNVDGLGAKAVKIVNGTDPIAGDLATGDILDLVYDADAGYFRIKSLVNSVINGNASMSDAAIKTAYENNADSNAFTDAQEAKVDLISVTHEIDLDDFSALARTSSGVITAGDPVAINSDGTVSKIAVESAIDKATRTAVAVQPQEDEMPGHNSIVEIEPGKMLVVTADEDDASDKGVAFVVTFDPDDIDGTITAHTAVEFESGKTTNTNACLVADNKVLAVYSDADNTEQATAVVMQIVGTSIIVGAPVVYDTGTTHSNTSNTVDCATLDTNKAVVFSSAGAKVYVCTITGLTPSFGTGVAVDGTSAVRGNLAQIGQDSFLCCYAAGSDSSYHTGVVGTASGATISLGTAVRLYAGTAIKMNCGVLKSSDDGIRAFAWNNSAANNFHFLTINGRTLTVDATATVTATYQNLYVNTDATAMVGILRSGGAFDFTMQSWDIDLEGEAITYRATTTEAGTSQQTFFGKWYSTRKFFCYYEDTNTGYIQLFEPRRSTRNNFIGFASSTVGDAASVLIHPAGALNANQSGLTAGKDYYLEYDGSLTTEETEIWAGISLSATEILVGYGRKT